jgi:cobalt-zinc-cadmium efflux system outer membrane protein
MPTVFSKTFALTITVFATALAGGCVLAPREAKQEQSKLRDAGPTYAKPFEQRELPELPSEPTWQDVLHRAFLANGDLEAAYHEWAMAVARIQQRGAYPNTPVALDFEYMFSGERMKSFDRLTTTAGFDPMESLSFPSKVYQAGMVATRDAQVAGGRFRAAKFALQRKVLGEWADYTLRAEQVRVQRENVSLLSILLETAGGRVRAGGPQQDLLRTEIEYRMAESRLRDIEAELPQMRARLNAMLGRAADAPLVASATMPRPRPIPADDAALLAAAADANPELAAFARDVQGRSDALELARMQYIPDFTPSAGLTGTVAQFIGLGITLPTVIPEIQGMIKEARADLRRMQAMYRQARFDRTADLVASLSVLRNAERQAALFRDQVQPAAERVLSSARQSYAAGTSGYLDLIEAQRTLFEVRLMIAEAQAVREKSLADVEALAGIDVETLARPATTTTRPDVEPAAASQPFSSEESKAHHDD